MLCLTNGQKIKVTEKIRIMFEVENLVHASLATVSRCGMVYMEPKQLGTETLIKKFTEFSLPEEYPNSLKKLFFIIIK